jgi:hypothetical protein
MHVTDYAGCIQNSGSTVVEALFYNPEGRGFENRWGECILTIYLILLAAPGPGVYSASSINKYQKQKNHVSGEQTGSVRRADNLTAICEPIV